MRFYFLLATGGFAVVEDDRLVQMAAEIEAISGRDRSAAYLIRNARLLMYNLILPHQSVVKQRDTAEEKAAQPKGGVTAKGGKRKPFAQRPVVGGKKLKESDGPSPSTCPDVPEEEGVEEEEGGEVGEGSEGGGDGDGQGGSGVAALTSEQDLELDEALRRAFGESEGESETEKAKETGKAVAGTDPSSKGSSARVIPAMQGELLSSADSIFDRDLEIFYGSLPSWNEIQDLLQYPTPPPGLYNRCVSSLFFLFNLAHFLNCGLLYVRNTCSLFQGQARRVKRRMFDTALNNLSRGELPRNLLLIALGM